MSVVVNLLHFISRSNDQTANFPVMSKIYARAAVKLLKSARKKMKMSAKQLKKTNEMKEAKKQLKNMKMSKQMLEKVRPMDFTV